MPRASQASVASSIELVKRPTLEESEVKISAAEEIKSQRVSPKRKLDSKQKVVSNKI